MSAPLPNRDHLATRLIHAGQSPDPLTGAVMCPTDCALLLRSLKTLSVRVDRQAANAALLAQHLEANAQALGLSEVIYPGLASHPGHAVAARQMENFGALISLKLTGGLERVERVLSSTRLFHFAVSLGGVESLIQHPASLTHAVMPQDQRTSTGIGDDLIRLSVGIEDAGDLLADLLNALT